MVTARFVDRFDRDDGGLGSNYTLPCGLAQIFDETVQPITMEGAQSGDSPIFAGTTAQKTQVLYTADDLDCSDYSVRGVWSHFGSVQGFVDIDQLTALATQDPSFTLLARMTKDPLLVDLGLDEQPLCYDQGYGLRVTCPRDGTAPILKLIKFSTKAIPPGVRGPTTATEPDGAFVLATLTLTEGFLNHAEGWDGSGNVPYRGFVQSMRLRIRRRDDQVILDAYHNERGMHTAVLSYTDYAHPLWGVVGRPGFEFLSATLADQPAGASPFGLAGTPLMACHLFETETVKDIEPARVSTPSNLDTYDRVTQRVIQIVERNGDAKYTATLNGQTKMAVYLGFVIDAEKEIIRTEGYYSWLYREERVHLKDGVSDYELPENCGLIELARPGNWNAVPLRELSREEASREIGNVTGSGRPRWFSRVAQGPNNRIVLRFWPAPRIVDSAEVYVIVEYHARPIVPNDPTCELPFVPQEHTDVLIYGAAMHALLMDTDAENTSLVSIAYAKKLKDLRTANNRKQSTRQTVMRSVADLSQHDVGRLLPPLRISQLNGMLI